MRKEYVVTVLSSGEERIVWMTETEWFEVFRSGVYQGEKLRCFEPLGAPGKCVFFEEQKNAAASS